MIIHLYLELYGMLGVVFILNTHYVLHKKDETILTFVQQADK